MKDVKRKFIKMLELEFEDLKDDIEYFIEKEQQKKEEGLITNYVFMENLTALQIEITKIKDFIAEIDKLDTGKFQDVDEMLEEIKNVFVNKFKIHSFKKSSVNILTKKIDKIQKYML